MKTRTPRPKRTTRAPAKFKEYSVPLLRNSRVAVRSCSRLKPPSRLKRNAKTVLSPAVGSRKNVARVVGVRYPVERIITHKVTKWGVTKFKLKWSPPDEGLTYEAIENIAHLPLMIKKYQMREEMKLRNRMRNGGSCQNVVKFQFPKISQSLELKLRHPAESYAPLGTEKVLKILEEIKVDKGIVLWLVQFEGLEVPHFVNKQRIIYYFPLISALYVHECAMFLNPPTFKKW